MNLTMLLDMAAEGFGDRVVVGSRNGGLTAARLRELAAGGATAVQEAGAARRSSWSRRSPASPSGPGAGWPSPATSASSPTTPGSG